MFLDLDRGYLSKKSKEELDIMILLLGLQLGIVRVGVLPQKGRPPCSPLFCCVGHKPLESTEREKKYMVILLQPHYQGICLRD